MAKGLVNDWKREGWVGWDVEKGQTKSGNLKVTFPLKVPTSQKDAEGKTIYDKIYAAAYGEAGREILALNIQKGERVILSGEHTMYTNKEGKTYVGITLWKAHEQYFPERNEGNPTEGGNFNNQVDESYTPF